MAKAQATASRPAYTALSAAAVVLANNVVVVVVVVVVELDCCDVVALGLTVAFGNPPVQKPQVPFW